MPVNLEGLRKVCLKQSSKETFQVFPEKPPQM
jgi:hypothetical protein